VTPFDLYIQMIASKADNQRLHGVAPDRSDHVGNRVGGGSGEIARTRRF
jgi:hypothetical protein